MPRGKELTPEQREQIINNHFQKISIRKIAQIVQKSRKCVTNVIKCWKETGDSAPKRRAGKKPLINADKLPQIEQLVKKNRRLSLQQLKETWNKDTNLQVSSRTFRRYLYKLNLRRRVAIRKPYITEVNRQRRLDWANTYVDKPLSFWHAVLFF